MNTVSRYFDLAINKKGNGNSKITMGLYWIAPEAFLNLDSRNEWYIYESGKIPTELVSILPKVESKISAENYFEIVEKLRAFLKSGKSELKDFKELSFAAWNHSTEVNRKVRALLMRTLIQNAIGFTHQAIMLTSGKNSINSV